VEHLILYFKHDIRAIIPYTDFIFKVRSEIIEKQLGEYLGDDMAIDGGDAEGIFSCPDSRALFNFIKDDLSKLEFMQGAKVTFVFGEQGVGSPEESFYI